MRNDRRYSTQPAHKPIPQAMPDTCGKLSLWSAKYDLTFFGDTKEECQEKLANFDANRSGERIKTKGVLNNTVVGRANDE